MTQIIPDTTDTIPPEPANKTALYWPETPDTTPAALLIRDDQAAATVVDYDPPARWSMPNDVGPWVTWPQVLEVLAELELDLADAIQLTPVGGDDPVPFVHPELGPMPGYVVGQCGHRVAQSEWRAGFRVCERCPDGAS